MSERWGIDLSMSAVRLMRRDGGHWQEIASEPLDGDDLDARLQKLAAQANAPDSVDIFLPRDQILYTDVKVTSEDSASADIDAAMEGRTPYALADLEIDWELTDDGIAKIAAIARKTLDEAETFASQLGFSARHFSALAEAEDFPRMPDFGLGKAEIAAPAPNRTPETVAFATQRTDPPSEEHPSRQEAEGEAPQAPDGPVVRVDDPEPVMQVVAERPEPLDPGPALPRDGASPRIRTDMALPTEGGTAAASLAPEENTKYGRDPLSATHRSRIIGYGLAAVLTIAIGIVVWSILPDSIETGETQPTLAEPTPPDSQQPPILAAEAPATPSAPGIETTPELPANVQGVVRSSVVTPAQADVRTGALPATPDPVGALPESADAPPPILALEGGPDGPGVDIVLRTPPRTWPGSVSLPALASLSPDPPGEPGIAPPVFLPEPVIAESVPEIPEITAPSDDDGSEVALAALPDPASAPVDIPAEAPEVAALPPADTTPDPESATQIDAAGPAEPAIEPLPAPTALAQSLTATRTRARPDNFVAEIERQQFGGRTRAELSDVRPASRPESAQRVAEAERGSTAPSVLAVETTLAPRARPVDIDAIIANVQLAQRQAELAALEAPDTSDAVRSALADTDLEPEDEPTTNPRNSPRLAIPSDANVARRATIEDAIRLNRINLVGVYGLPSDRRALVRLPSGRYVKVKVGDKIDGGTVAAIGDNVLQYRKGGRTVQLELPKG